jgi:hypothetical protein
MDPNQAWRDLSEAISKDQWRLAAELADGLLEWLGRDGFPPAITGIAVVDTIVTRATCEAVACWDLVV